MAVLDTGELSRAVKTGKNAPCWLLFSTDDYLLTSAGQSVVRRFVQEGAEEATVLEGPVPDIGRAVEAAGSISLFGGRRVVLFSHLDPAATPEQDLALLAELCAQTENAVLIFTILVKEGKAYNGKLPPLKLPAAAKALQAAAEKYGVVAALEKPNEGSAAKRVCQWAKELGAECEPDAAELLVDRCGVDLLLLRAETEKLAAGSGYGVIDTRLVEQLASRSVEADVFELSRLILAGRGAQAFQLLDRLFYLQNEPIPIAAALGGAYLDMYRVKCGQAAGVGYSQVFRDLGYTGKDYRLKKSGEAAGRSTPTQLAACLLVLNRLDAGLKSSAMDKKELLRLAVGELLALGQNRRNYAH